MSKFQHWCRHSFTLSPSRDLHRLQRVCDAQLIISSRLLGSCFQEQFELGEEELMERGSDFRSTDGPAPLRSEQNSKHMRKICANILRPSRRGHLPEAPDPDSAPPRHPSGLPSHTAPSGPSPETRLSLSPTAPQVSLSPTLLISLPDLRTPAKIKSQSPQGHPSFPAHLCSPFAAILLTDHHSRSHGEYGNVATNTATNVATSCYQCRKCCYQCHYKCCYPCRYKMPLPMPVRMSTVMGGGQ